MTPRSRGTSGFTLVEAMLGIAILGVITVAMAGTFLVGSRSLTNEARVLSADTAVSHASFSLTRDFNSATTVPTGTIAYGNPPLTLTYGSPPVTVAYSIDANNELIRTVSGSAQVAARGITSVVIAAAPASCYATATIQPSATSAAAVPLNLGSRPAGCL